MYIHIYIGYARKDDKGVILVTSNHSEPYVKAYRFGSSNWSGCGRLSQLVLKPTGADSVK